MDPASEGVSWFRNKRQRQLEQQEKKQNKQESSKDGKRGSEASSSDEDEATSRAGKVTKAVPPPAQQQAQPGTDEQPRGGSQQDSRHKQQGEGDNSEAATPPPTEEEPSEEMFQAEDRPRVLAYSDSDSDVETHFKRVKKHLRPPKEDDEQQGAAGGSAENAEAAQQAAVVAQAAAAEATAQQEAVTKMVQQRSGSRLGNAAGGLFASVAHHVVPHLTTGFAARLCTLVLLRRLNPSLEDIVELLTLAIPVTGKAAAKAGVRLGGLPPPLVTAGREVEQMGKAASVLALARLLGAAGGKLRQRYSVSIRRRLRRMRSSVNVASLQSAEAVRQEPAKPPETAAEFAAVYYAEIAEMRRMLAENGIEPPAERFDDAELIRFAGTCGLLTAKTLTERAAAVEGGVRRIVHTVEWLGSQKFLSEHKLKRWDRLVCWRSADAQGHPILLVRVGRALQLVKPDRMSDFIDAVLSQVNWGLATELSNAGPGRDRMVVVLDARGASSLALTRHMALLKHLAVVLNQHYPDRLHRLYLLELPLLLRWAVQAVLPLLHPVTRDKVQLSSIEDPDLPVTVAYLTKRRSAGYPLLRRSTSDVTLPGSGGSTPGALSPCPSAMDILPPPPHAGPAADLGLDRAVGFGRDPAGAAAGLSQRDSMGAQTSGRPESLDAAWDEYAQTAASAKPGTLEAAWDACQQSASAVMGTARRSFEFFGLPPRGEGELAGNGPAAEVAPVWRQQQRHGQGQDLLFHKSISTPMLRHGGSSALELGSPKGLYQAPGAAALDSVPDERGAGTAQWQPHEQQQAKPLGPGREGGIASFAVPLSPEVSFDVLTGPASDSSDPTLPTQTASGLLREVSDAASAVTAYQAAFQDPAGERHAGVAERGATPEAAAASSSDAAVRASSTDSQGRSWASMLGWLGRAPSSSLPTEGAGSKQGPVEPSVGMSNSIAHLGQGVAQLVEQQQRAGEAAGSHLGSTPLRPHRLGSLTSSSVASSAGSSPRTPTRGGLKDLPERRRRRVGLGTPRMTPKKPSLRKDPSLERTNSSGSNGHLGSHPLRHQSSVSWAEELESVKEIVETPGSPSRQSSPVKLEPSDHHSPHPPQQADQEGEQQPSQGGSQQQAALDFVHQGGPAVLAVMMRGMLLMVLVAALLQRLLLGGLAGLPPL